jgi:hypothetical protein
VQWNDGSSNDATPGFEPRDLIRADVEHVTGTLVIDPGETAGHTGCETIRLG